MYRFVFHCRVALTIYDSINEEHSSWSEELPFTMVVLLTMMNGKKNYRTLTNGVNEFIARELRRELIEVYHFF
jgi:hypothetical protein